MADIDFDKFVAALEAEGVILDREVAQRAYRKVANPAGCEYCGMHSKVGEVKKTKGGYGLFTACCGTYVGPTGDPDDDDQIKALRRATVASTAGRK